jgi:hypothetical protein
MDIHILLALLRVSSDEELTTLTHHSLRHHLPAAGSTSWHCRPMEKGISPARMRQPLPAPGPGGVRGALISRGQTPGGHLAAGLYRHPGGHCRTDPGPDNAALPNRPWQPIAGRRWADSHRHQRPRRAPDRRRNRLPPTTSPLACAVSYSGLMRASGTVVIRLYSARLTSEVLRAAKA